MRYVSYATKPSSPVSTWNRDDNDDDNRRGGKDGGHDSGSGMDWDRGRGDHNDHDDNADCRRSSGGQWRCSGHNGHSDGWDRNDALRKYLRLRPIIYPAPIIYPYPGRPRGGKQDIDIDVKNVYNIEQPDTVPTSGGRDVPPPVDPTPDVSGGFSLAGLPSWGLPAIVIGGVLVLVLVMKK